MRDQNSIETITSTGAGCMKRKRSRSTGMVCILYPSSLTCKMNSGPVASSEEIDFVIKILDSVSGPALDKVESLLLSTDTWDNVARNDFCR
jgi:hypothetical protein